MAHDTLGYAIGRCRLGYALVARGSAGVRVILLGATPAALRRDLHECFPGAALEERADLPELAGAIALIGSPREPRRLTLDPAGSPFQRRVWRALRGVAAGDTVTYGELARRLGLPRGARAVASACAANPIAVAIPCHRVVPASGGIGGYRWGAARKRALLAREAAA